MPGLRCSLRWRCRPNRRSARCGRRCAGRSGRFAFIESCRRDLGDTFSLTFLGFERPMVMISDPAAIKALYTEREHGLPPGRNIFLEPILGSRSLLLLEGADHLAHRKLMLPAFHGERMRSYEPMVTEIVDAEIDSWPLGEEFPLHPRMQAVTLEVILRVVFGVSEGRGWSDCAACSRTARPRPPRRDPAARPAARRFGGRALGRFEARLGEVDELLYAEIAEHRAERRPRGARRHPLGADPRPLRGRRGDDRHRPARPADDPAARRPRDDRDALAWTFDLLLRHPRADAAPARLARGRRGRLPAGDDHRVAAPAAGRARSPAAASPRDLVADGLDAAGRDRRHAGDLARPHPRRRLPRALRLPPRALPRRGPDTYSWIPFGGGIRRCLGAAFAEFEMRIVLREVLTRCELHKANPSAERVARRNITLSPRDGTPVVSPRATRRASASRLWSSRPLSAPGAPWPSGRSCRSRRSPRRRRGRGSAPRWCRSAP